LDAGRLEVIRASASDLASVSLADALGVCLLVRDRDVAGYERAIACWVGCFALAASEATVTDLRDALDILQALPADPDGSMERLSALCVRHGVG